MFHPLLCYDTSRVGFCADAVQLLHRCICSCCGRLLLTPHCFWCVPYKPCMRCAAPQLQLLLGRPWPYVLQTILRATRRDLQAACKQQFDDRHATPVTLAFAGCGCLAVVVHLSVVVVRLQSMLFCQRPFSGVIWNLQVDIGVELAGCERVPALKLLHTVRAES